MAQPAPSYAHHQLQLKILNCTNDDARHSDAETKIAVHISMAHVEHTNANITGENVTAQLKDIGIAYYRKRNTFTVNVGPAVLKTINEKITPSPSRSPRGRT